MNRRAIERLRAANPVLDEIMVQSEWREALRAKIAALPEPSTAPARWPRALVPLVAAALLALLAIPSYGVARDLIAWVRGEPAPQAIVEEFESYAPELGYRPEPDGAILVAVDKSARLYSTPNDKGSYCLALTAPGRPSGDGGTCINPDWADEPLIAGTLGATGGDSVASTQFIAGRTDHPDAQSVTFAGPDGGLISVPVGFDGFFVAAVEVPRSACGIGDDWRPLFHVRDTRGEDVASRAITLLFNQAAGVCSFVPPHPPWVK